MNGLITVSGVRGFIDENGVAQLNLEDVSRGLGFTRDKNGTEYVIWDRVCKYLTDFGFHTSVEKENMSAIVHDNQLPEFIPENIFYRLAMKAKNRAAEIFQAKVANEILPSIRKTGQYFINQPQNLEDLIILQAQSVKALKAVVNTIKDDVETIKQHLKLAQPAASFDLPVSVQNEPQECLRKKIREYIWMRASVYHMAVGRLWNKLYTEYEIVYGINLREEAKQSKLNALRYAEKNKLLAPLWDLAQKV